jgi:hypothetical protein
MRVLARSWQRAAGGTPAQDFRHWVHGVTVANSRCTPHHAPDTPPAGG